MAVSTVTAPSQAASAGRLHGLGCCTADEALSAVGAERGGLAEEDVERRREEFGANDVAHERLPAWHVQLFHAFATPFTIVLTLLSAVSWATGDARAVVVIGAMVALATITRFIQEFRSNRAALALQAMVKTKATVQRRLPERRSGEQEAEPVPPRPPSERRREAQAESAEPVVSRKIELAIEELVPGDIVHLSAGDMVPADVRVLTAKDLFVSQSALTGESLPVEKWPIVQDGAAAATASLPELATICFMGTSVVSGTATAVVVTTGGRTYFGSMAKSIVGRRHLTSFDKGVNSVSWLLIRFMLVMVPVVFLINGFTKHDWLGAFLFGVAVAVGLTPEMLPMIVTANLAKGAVAMARRKTIVKRLNAIQNFGAMDILCTDKTGTLTQDRIVLERHLNLVGEDDEEVLGYAYLNSYYQTGLKNLLDVAVLEHAELREQLQVERDYRKVDEIPFDFTRRRMSVVVSHGPDAHLLLCKGAVEEILPLCPQARDEGRVLPISDEARRNAVELLAEMNEDGLRAVAVAYREFPASERAYSVADEADLVLAGFIGFLDPPKETAAPALAALREHGVRVKVITGDNEAVSRKVCHDVGLDPGDILTGPALEGLDDAALTKAAESVTVFAKITPIQKVRIVAALRRGGHTVGFLGDGINDAGALREADVGISVDSAADIARESADIILLEKSLMVLEEGVIEGRQVFGNIIKYIKMTASSNFGNVFSVLVASAFLPFLPMVPIQLLTVNLLYDFSQAAIPFDHMDADYVRMPRKWRADDIGRFMLIVGPTSSVFDITTFLLMWFVFGARVGHETLFRSGWFVESLLSQTLIVHLIRTAKVPFIQSRASWPVLLTTAAIVVVGLALPFSFLGDKLGIAPLPPAYFGWLAVTMLLYGALVHSVKRRYMRRYGTWL
ncbi:MAG: magnesium-translocating P-type ATPase [Gemmatimonadales bacterium]